MGGYRLGNVWGNVVQRLQPAQVHAQKNKKQRPPKDTTKWHSKPRKCWRPKGHNEKHSSHAHGVMNPNGWNIEDDN